MEKFLTNTTSTMQCHVCGLTSKYLNKNNIVNPEAIDFGLSTLHARIRIFESLLHLTYKQPVKKLQIRTDSDKNPGKADKNYITKKVSRKDGINRCTKTLFWQHK